MMEKYSTHAVEKHGTAQTKLSYVSPHLIFYGAVRDLTLNAGGTRTETSGGCGGQPLAPSKSCSERRVKGNIAQVGIHPLGFGLYLFDYKTEYLELFGYGRQFGVMIDEVETVLPEAVSTHPDGFKRVDYAKLGIERHLH